MINEFICILNICQQTLMLFGPITEIYEKDVIIAYTQTNFISNGE